MFIREARIQNQTRIQRRAVSLCHTAKVDPHEGHLRPELVALVPPGLRKAIQLFANAERLLPHSVNTL